MDLRGLEYFREVCRTESFTQAAANLYVAQPGITNAIRKLEAEFKVQLFKRDHRSVSLTPEGKVLYQRVEKLLNFANDIKQELWDFNNFNKGNLSLGLGPQIGASLFPDIYLDFSKRYPKIDFSVLEEGAITLLDLIEKGELDLAIVVLPEAYKYINIYPLCQQTIKLCVAKDHWLSSSSVVNFAELSQEKFILRKSGSFHREIILHQCRKNGFVPNIIFSSNQTQLITSMVAKNTGIAFFMDMAVKNNSDIVTIDLQEPLLVTIALIWRKEKYVSKAMQAFIEFIRSETTFAS